MNRRRFSQLAAGATVLGACLSNKRSFAAFDDHNHQTSGPTFRFSTMLSTVGRQADIMTSIDLIADAGYRGIELTGQYKMWKPEELQQAVLKMKAKGLIFDSIAGARVTLADPAGGDVVKEQVASIMPFATQLGCPQLILTSGARMPDLSPELQRQAVIDNLKRALEITSKSNINIVLEPIDLLENKNAYLNSVTEAFDIVRSINSPDLRVLYDFYHEQRQAGNVIEKLTKNIDMVGLVHIADVPDRHEPGTGEMNYNNIYKKLNELKYVGFVAMEFRPTGEPGATLKKARLDAIAATT